MLSVAFLSCALGLRPSAGASSVTVATFDVPGAKRTFASGINGTGQIVGTFQDAGGKWHDYLRIAGGTVTTIDIPGATAISARGINDAGQIVGYFTDASKRDHGFVAAR